ncbi:MAG: hypothetical protein MUF01_05315 [Bryobacterales bacterium]|jgi:hypothetical protein|nr:hypothetical protein [Bryobacterales bacterium]
MSMPLISRRGFAFAALALTQVRPVAAAEYFRKTTWFEKQEGSDKPVDHEGSLMLDRDARVLAFSAQERKRMDLPLASITNVVYERAKRPRYGVGLLLAWPLLFTKTKKHFLTVQYKDNAGEGRYALFQLHKDNFREVLAALEAATDIKVERLEEK